MKTLAAIGVLLLGAPLAVVLLFASMLGAEHEQQRAHFAAAGCLNWTGPLLEGTGLSDDQMARAVIIYDVAIETGTGSAGAVVGIATAMQESTLGAHPASHQPNQDGDVGLFQQRSLPGWYADGQTQAENLTILADDRYQARGFFLGHTTTSGWHIPGLQDIEGWQQMSVTQAAQSVQVSAYPDAYAAHEALARAVVAALEGAPDQLVVCGPAIEAIECPPTGMASERGQTPDALRVMRCIKAKWPQLTSMGGLRPGDPRDHGTGRAVDVMIPNYLTPAGIALGDEIAEWTRTHAAQLGVTYIIWREHIWSTARADQGWRRCGITGSCYTGPDHSAAHLDHVHISVHGEAGTGFAPPTNSTAGGPVVLPVEAGTYRLTARFGQSGPHWRTTHTGLDFAAARGTPVRAVFDGVVASAGWQRAYGNLVRLRAADGTQAWYAHLDTTSVTHGQHVTAGQVIGTVGMTGNSTGSHLHFEIRTDGRPIDPMMWLQREGLHP